MVAGDVKASFLRVLDRTPQGIRVGLVSTGPSRAVDLLSRLGKQKGIDGGLALSRFMPDRPNDFLVCVTEVNSRAEIDALVEGLRSV